MAAGRSMRIHESSVQFQLTPTMGAMATSGTPSWPCLPKLPHAHAYAALRAWAWHPRADLGCPERDASLTRPHGLDWEGRTPEHGGRYQRFLRKHEPVTKEPTASSAPARLFAVRALWVVLLIAVPIAVFGQIARHPFVAWDDGMHIYENNELRPLSASNIWRFWRKPYANLYIPVSYTFFAVEAWVASPDASDPASELDPRWFHGASIALHIGSVLLVYLILLELLSCYRAACAGALLFAVHPVQVETVAWASCTRDLLAAFFSFLAIWLYLRFAKSGSSADSPRQNRPCREPLVSSLGFGTSPPRWRWASRVLSKPSAVATPPSSCW